MVNIARHVIEFYTQKNGRNKFYTCRFLDDQQSSKNLGIDQQSSKNLGTMPPEYKSLYYIVNEADIPVYNTNNLLVGHTTGFLARPNARSLGSVEVMTPTGSAWIEGYGIRIVGMGIKWFTI